MTLTMVMMVMMVVTMTFDDYVILNYPLLLALPGAQDARIFLLSLNMFGPLFRSLVPPLFRSSGPAKIIAKLSQFCWVYGGNGGRTRSHEKKHRTFSNIASRTPRPNHRCAPSQGNGQERRAVLSCVQRKRLREEIGM